MRVVVVRTYVDMRSPEEAMLAYPDIPGLDVRAVEPPDIPDYRVIVEDVGRDVLWVRRLGWRDEEYEKYLNNVDVKAWIARLGGEPAGLIELVKTRDGSVRITHVGVRSKYQGRGLGKYLISYLTERAWELKPSRVWLDTLSIDGDYALKNYIKRGFKLWKRRAGFVSVPDSLAPELRERMESARARGVHPGFLRYVEAYLWDNPAGLLAKKALFRVKRAFKALLSSRKE